VTVAIFRADFFQPSPLEAHEIAEASARPVEGVIVK
jgi:hypothetical protein